MKKFATILVLLFVLSISTFAEEGQIPAGGRSCPQGQTCFVDDGQYPAGGKTCPQGQTCLTDDGQYPIGNRSNNTIIESVFDFLNSILG